MKRPTLKFLVDVGVGKKVEQFLKSGGYSIISVREINPRMSDEDILNLADKDDCIIITMDKDFGEVVFRLSMKHSGVILLRLEDATGSEKVQVISSILKEYSQQLPNSFSVYQNNKFRIRKINKKPL